MRLYVDDMRQAPEGWVSVKTAQEAIEILKTGAVEELSLDHDLGAEENGTGYNVLLWIEAAVGERGFVPPILHIHTANPPAHDKMTQALNRIMALHRKNNP